MPASKYAKLRDVRVLLLGGTSGIGFATAEACIEAGAIVIISSSTPDRLSSALSKLKTCYPEAATANKIHGHICDVSQAESLEANITALLEFATNNNTHKLDHITYTAANVPRLPGLADYQASETKSSTVIIRYDAPIMLGKLAPAYMNPGPRSSITFTGASTASKPTPGRGILTGLGASTEGVAKGLAVDLAPIRVNVVAPGTVDTDLLRALAGPDPKVQAGFKEMLKKVTLLDKVGAAEEVAEAYVYFMKDANVTGAVIHTDGGRLLK
ncbi:Tropinone reductase 2 [Lipomyces kononenkoae]|uniref:Tropinone reductase 2 n=1 Tax=Lipomyces kononenkoae TaxID=34357 RepID=A0ACC3SWA2_LIPKO